MAKLEGVRPDETAQSSSQRTGPEKWVLIAMIVVAVALVVGLLVIAAG